MITRLVNERMSVDYTSIGMHDNHLNEPHNINAFERHSTKLYSEMRYSNNARLVSEKYFKHICTKCARHRADLVRVTHVHVTSCSEQLLSRHDKCGRLVLSERQTIFV